MRAVAVKTIEQQSIQALHRLRRRAVADRTGLSNQVRGLLSEFGIVFNQGVATLRKHLPEILEDGENALHPMFRDALALKYQQLCELDKLINELTAAIEKEARQHAEIKRLQSIPGFGAIGNHLAMAETSLLHSGWFHDSTAVVGKIRCLGSVSAVTNTCAACWCMVRDPLSFMPIRRRTH